MLSRTDYIVISKSKSVLHSVFQFYSLSHIPIAPFAPPSRPQSYRVLVLELQGRWKKNQRNGWEKKRLEYPQQSKSFC